MHGWGYSSENGDDDPGKLISRTHSPAPSVTGSEGSFDKCGVTGTPSGDTSPVASQISGGENNIPKTLSEKTLSRGELPEAIPEQSEPDSGGYAK